MVNLQLLLNGALILIVATVLSNSQNFRPDQHIFANIEYDTSENVPSPQPIRYDVDLTLLNIESTNDHFKILGKCNITIRVAKPIISFGINLSPSIKILASSFRIRDKPATTFTYTTKRYTDQLSSYQEWLFPNKLENEVYVISFEYEDTVHNYDKGFFRISYERHKVSKDGNNTQWLVATNSQPNGAHQIFPCFELPGTRTPIKIIVKVNNQYKILSNMGDNHEHEHYSDGLHKMVYQDTPQISVYQVAILIYNFNYITELQIAADKIYCRNSDMHIYYAKTVIANVTFFLQNQWPQVKHTWNPVINYALIPGFPYDSADGWRLVFLREAKVIYNQNIDTFGRKIAVTRFLAQKVTYQWLGSIVSFYNWTDLWVNDGVAIFYGMDAINKIYPETQMMNLFVVQDVHEALHLDTIMKSRYSKISSFDIDTSSYFVRYLKGPALIYMLHHMMTSGFINQGIREHLTSQNRREPPTINEFWRFMQEVSIYNEQSKFKNKTVKDVMNTWIENNYPILHVRTNIDAEQEDIIVTVTQENSEKNNWHKWWILITWFTDHLITYSDRITPSLSKWLRPNEKRKTLTTLDSTYGWIIVNTKRSGYYRVSYDDQNWRRIGWFLQSRFTDIHVLNRAQLLDDAFHFVRMKRLEIEIFLDLTIFLSEDTDYIAWYPMFKILEYMSPVFAFYNKGIGHLKLHLLSLLVPLLGKIGYNARSEEDKLTQCLREEAVKWTCILGNLDCKLMALQKLDLHLQNREENKLPPGWKKWTYCEGMTTGDSLIWHNAVRAWDEERDDTLLQCLMCSEDYYIATQSFRTLKDKSIIKHGKPRDEVIHFIFFLEKYANHTIIIEDIVEEFLENRPRAVTQVAALSIMISNIYTMTGLEKIMEYADVKYDHSSLVKSRILSKIEERRKQFSKVESYAHIITKSEYQRRRRGMINQSN